MKTLIIFLCAVLVTSCSSYIDSNEKSINTDYLDFKFLSKKNEFVYKSKVNSSADNEVYYTANFKITLPKKIKNWYKSNNEFYFEYDSKQIIYIESGYKNVGQEVNWSLNDFQQDNIYKIFGAYWDKQNYDESYLHKNHNERLTKLYTNGKVKILLYNIKKENYASFLEHVKSFKYLE